MNLYEILGVEKDETPIGIKVAYRRKVKDAHPDAGGDRNFFEAVQQAYEILSDPEKRAAYDRDGSINVQADIELAAALDAISRMMAEIMTEVGNPAGPEQIYEDLVEKMRNRVRAQIADITAQVAQAEGKAQRLERFAKRFSESGRLRRMVAAQVDSIHRAIPGFAAQADRLERMLELLKDERFLCDPAPAPSSYINPYIGFGMGGSSFGGTG